MFLFLCRCSQHAWALLYRSVTDTEVYHNNEKCGNCMSGDLTYNEAANSPSRMLLYHSVSSRRRGCSAVDSPSPTLPWHARRSNLPVLYPAVLRGIRSSVCISWIDHDRTTKKLLDHVRDALCSKQYSYRTAESYLSTIKRYVLFHTMRYPRERGQAEIESLLTQLAVERNVIASTHNQARATLLFLPREVVR